VTSTLGKDLLAIEPLTADQIRLILDTAEPFKEISERAIKKVPALRGSTVVNLFFEPSTRTRISFEFAEKRLSADTVNVASSGSSVSKGETLVDTARNLEAMRIDMVVIRHGESGAAQFLAERIESTVINAGDGTHEHPTQGLLDLLTLRDHFGDLRGVRVCICGDVLHSRVARSNIWGLQKLGAEVAVCGPRSLLPNAIAEFGVKVFDRIDAAMEWAQALNVLRLQLERMTAGYIPSLREYNRVFGVTSERLARLKNRLIILHPGPMNRGVEIAAEVARLAQAGGVRPGLAAVLVGDNDASRTYVRNKRRACEKVGIDSFLHELPAATAQAQLLALIARLNADSAVSGILVQLPLPRQINEAAVVASTVRRVAAALSASGIALCRNSHP